MVRNGPSSSNSGSGSSSSSNFDGFRHAKYDAREPDRRGGGGGRGKLYPRSTPPPGFPGKPRGGGSWDYGNRARGLNHNVDREKTNSDELVRNRDVSAESVRTGVVGSTGLGVIAQLDRPGPPSGSNLHSVCGSDIKESLMNLEENENVEARAMKQRSAVTGAGEHDIDEIGERLGDTLLIEEVTEDKIESKQHQNSREKVNLSSKLGYCILNVVVFP